MISQRCERRRTGRGGCLLAILLAGSGSFVKGGDGEPAASKATEAATEAFRDTQVNLRLELPDGERRFRASVLRRAGRSLLILTAAHCLSRADRSREIELTRGDRAIKAVVRQVVRNPNFDEAQTGSIPGADNALALIELEPEDAEELAIVEALRPSHLLVSRPLLRNGEVVNVAVVDQKDRGYVLRAANYSNPRWLEWGPHYQPIPGDSGSGVFVTVPAQRGEGGIRALLVGVVTDRSPTGGGASIVYGREPWLVEAITELEKLMYPAGGR
jgi:hypothetical protein